MFKWSAIDQFKAKFFINLKFNSFSHVEDNYLALPKIVAIGPEIIIFNQELKQDLQDNISALSLYLCVLGKWKEYRPTLLPKAATAFQDSLFGTMKQLCQSPFPLLIKIPDEQIASFKMDLNLARSR